MQKLIIEPKGAICPQLRKFNTNTPSQSCFPLQLQPYSSVDTSSTTSDNIINTTAIKAATHTQ